MKLLKDCLSIIFIVVLFLPLLLFTNKGERWEKKWAETEPEYPDGIPFV